MEEVLPFDVNISNHPIPLIYQVTIPSYKDSDLGKSHVTFYVIEIRRRGNKVWTLEKRFNEFAELNSLLSKTYGHLPAMPHKTLLPLKEPSQINERRETLEKYLQVLSKRKDIISSEPLKRFLQLDNFAPEIVTKFPTHITDLKGFRFGIRDFIYLPEEGIMFVTTGDMSAISRFDSYVSNMKIPWGAVGSYEGAAVLGTVECYKQVPGDTQFQFEKLWGTNFESQAIVLYWDQICSILVIGKDNGSIMILKVSGPDYSQYEQVCNFQAHSKRIMGLYLNSITEYVYSIGEDKKFNVHHAKNGGIVANIYCGSNPLTNMIVDKENKRAFISNKNGHIFIFDISSRMPRIIFHIKAQTKGNIRGLYFDAYKNYLLTANYDDGVLALIDMQKPGKERYASIVANFEGKKKVRSCVWSTYRTELYTGTEDGVLTFWDAKDVNPLFALKAHEGGVTRLQWMENERILISAGKDKKLSFYEIPKEWRDKKVDAELYREEKQRRQKENLEKFKEMLSRQEVDSDEDDLAGWATEP